MTARRRFVACARRTRLAGGLVCAVIGALGLGCGVDVPGAPSTSGPAAETACTTVGAGGSWWNQTFAEQSRRFHVELDATPSASPIDAVIGLGGGSASASAQLGPIVRFS